MCINRYRKGVGQVCEQVCKNNVEIVRFGGLNIFLNYFDCTNN